MEPADEKLLLRELRNSNYRAFDELYNRHWKSLYTHAVQKTGDKDEAEDLVQDLFMDIWDRRKKLPEINVPLRFYLKKAIVFKISVHFKKKGVHNRHLEDFQRFVAEYGHASLKRSDQTESEMQWEDLMNLVDRTIHEMPEKMRTIFLMSRSGEYSVNEMAEKLQVSPQTVRNQTSNALKRLRAATSQYHEHALILFWVWLTIS